MRVKRRYFLVSISGIDSEEEFEKRIFFVANKLSPLLAIKSNLRVIKDRGIKTPDGFLGVVSVNNVYKSEVVFILSLIGKFYKSNLLTLKSSGSLKKIKFEETRYGTNAK
jgi:RNase P/RNase MRP subunit POP5